MCCGKRQDRRSKGGEERLIWEALLPRAMSGSVVLPQPGGMWPSIVHVATKGHKDHQCLGLPLVDMSMSKRCSATRATLILVACAVRSVTLQQPGSKVMSVAPVAAEDHVVA